MPAPSRPRFSRVRALTTAATTALVALAALAAPVATAATPSFPRDMLDYLQCQVCQTPELTGSVQDSGCDYETVDKAVNEHFHPLLHELSRLTFFRYFKVDLGKECPYWQDDGMCASIDCAVCECPAHEIPATWYNLDQQARRTARPSANGAEDPATQSDEPGKPCSEQTGESALSRVDRKNAVAGESFREWEEAASDEVWTSQDDDEESMAYINLLENPERYTGYSGVQAERVWHAIYEENCFTPAEESAVDGLCLEERVYYRLISGLQASINTHISLGYKFGEGDWGLNPSLFVYRVGRHRERLQNLYFAYLFVMRAISKYRHELLQYDYSTGHAADDARVVEILRELVLEGTDKSLSGVSCPAHAECSSVLSGFDESALFHVQPDGLSSDELERATQEKVQLELQFREKFQNVSRIMDCVTCEKCRLWGKIQTLGLGTAIKILLADDVSQMPVLNRNELIALINVANNLSRSVDGVKMMRELEFYEAVKLLALVCGAAVVLVLTLIFCLRKRKASGAHSKTE